MRGVTDWIYYLPPGILGVVRWTPWFVRRIPAALYRPIRNRHREQVSVVVPVYQKDPAILALIIEAWLANDVAEVILVIDASDLVCQKIASRYPVTAVVTDVPGKRDALRVGWERARSPIVALVDSDTIWANNVAAEVGMPFADPNIGGVSTRQNVYNPVGFFLQRVNDMYLDYRYFDENAAQTVMGGRFPASRAHRGLPASAARRGLRRVHVRGLSRCAMHARRRQVPDPTDSPAGPRDRPAKFGPDVVGLRGHAQHLLPAAAAVVPEHLSLRPQGARLGAMGLATPIPRVHHGRQGRRQFHAPRVPDARGARRGPAGVVVRRRSRLLVVAEPLVGAVRSVNLALGGSPCSTES